MPGLIQNTLGNGNEMAPMGVADLPPENKIATVGSVGYDASKRTVDPEKETVAGQLNTVLASGSPVLERARTDARQAANARGLINTSMAVGAGEDAAIRSALPIATADANTYSTAARENTAAENTALSTNAGAANTAAITNANSANTVALQGLRGNQAVELANIEANYKNLIQTSAAGGKLYSDAVQAITTILANPDTSAEQKQMAVQKVTEMLKSGLDFTGSVGNVDLSGLLTFNTGGIATPPPPPNTPATSEQWDAWLNGAGPNGGAAANPNVPPVPGALAVNDYMGNPIWQDQSTGQTWPRFGSGLGGGSDGGGPG